MMSRGWIKGWKGWRAAVALAVTCSAGLSAQTHKVAKPEQVVRAVGVYEWTGDLTKPNAMRLVPVSIYIDNGFQDAGVYVARPVPFALLTGNVYELQNSGATKGTVELSFARHVQATDAQGDELFDDGWFGYGVYHAPPLTRVSTTKLKPLKNQPVITSSSSDSAGRPSLVNKSGSDSSAGSSSGSGSSGSGSGSSASSADPDRPTMHRRNTDSSDSGSDTSAASSKTSPASSGNNTSTAGSDSANDPDRPTMKRRADSDSSASSNGGSPSATSSGSSRASDDDPDRPTLRRRSPEDSKRALADAESAGTGASLTLNDDPDRPSLHKGKPAGSMNDNDLPALKGLPADMHQMIAVSDAVKRDEHVFTRPWEDDQEHALVLAKMQAYARAALATYKSGPAPVSVATNSGSSSAAAPQTTVNHGTILSQESVSAVQAAAESDPGAPTLKRGIPTKVDSVEPGAAASTPSKANSPAQSSTASPRTSAAKTASSRTASAKAKKASGPAPIELRDEDLRGYTLSYGGSPTFVYTADTGGTGTALRYVTVVAQDNGIGGENGGLGQIKLALVNVTDAAHLDRTPHMRLIDAVDAEASNRASLLFELRSQSSRQFALYRVIAARPEQIFLTGSTE
jgi:hypothetical protein